MTMRHASLLSALAFLALGASAGPLSAQLLTGQRVRVEVGGVERVAGTVTGLTAAAITLDIDGTSRTFARASLTGVELSTGIGSYWKTGAVVGGVVGGIGTFAVLNTGGSTNPCDSDANQDAMGMGACIGIAVGGAVGGALVGAFVGSLVHTERWSTVPLEAIRVSLLPSVPNGRGPSLGLAFAFTPPRR